MPHSRHKRLNSWVQEGMQSLANLRLQAHDAGSNKPSGSALVAAKRLFEELRYFRAPSFSMTVNGDILILWSSPDFDYYACAKEDGSVEYLCNTTVIDKAAFKSFFSANFY